jgi:predicted PurR-regulated permease PerM
MDSRSISSRAVFKVVAIVLVALGFALLLNHVVVEVKTTIRWVCAAIFLALALSPLVDLVERATVRGRWLPRWLAILVAYLIFLAGFVFLVLQVIPPIVREVEQLGSQLPTYVKDFENWANNNEQFRELNDKYDITSVLSQQASQLPAKLGDAAGAAKEITVGILNNVIEAVVVLTLAYFLLLDGGHHFERVTGRIRMPERERVRRVGRRIAGIVRSYVSVNLLLAALAGVFTWLALELLGVELAVPLGVLVGFLDLVPLIGFTVGGLLVAVVAALHDFPTALIVWAILFVVYQQVQEPGDPAAVLQARRAGPAGGCRGRRPRRCTAGRDPRRPARDPHRGGAGGRLRRALAGARGRLGRRGRGWATARGLGAVAAPRPVHLAAAVEEAGPERVRLRQPDRRRDAGDRDDQARQGPPELLLGRVDQRQRDPEQPDDTDCRRDAALEVVGELDPRGKPHRRHAGEAAGDDHRVDRLAAVLRPVDVLELDPQGELVER